MLQSCVLPFLFQLFRKFITKLLQDSGGRIIVKLQVATKNEIERKEKETQTFQNVKHAENSLLVLSSL